MARYVPLILRLTLAAIFITAGILKAIDPAAFAKDIGHYQIVNEPVAAALALYLPWLEIACGVALLWPRWSWSAGMILLALMLAFTGALLSAWLRGINLRCGCFGDRFALPAAWSLVRNIAITAALLAMLLIRRNSATRTDGANRTTAASFTPCDRALPVVLGEDKVSGTLY